MNLNVGSMSGNMHQMAKPMKMFPFQKYLDIGLLHPRFRGDALFVPTFTSRNRPGD